MPATTKHARTLSRQLMWLLAIWTASVAGLGLVAYGMRLLMRLAGLAA